ncbi:MAG: elongation factor EF-2 [Candidatus Thermoplasmatota archaeon]|nr:elongation factor EF-2 [Candidatus Thermoplasmatota archaeon]
MGRREDNIREAQKLSDKPKFIRNIGIAAHIDHGKTTLSDNLIAGAGMMSEELAGKQLLLDFDEQEQARGITINAANASMVHNYEGKNHLINLIDTPGHVDFGGDVTRAMRAVDGCVIVCCAVEGVMPQTETVVRQALREKVKPVLFINKVDRLINELKVTPEEMQVRFVKIIKQVNDLISKMVPSEFKKEWYVSPENGTVAFGSAYHNWAISIPFMKEQGVTFTDIYDHLNNGKQKELAKKAPIHQVFLDMIIHHLPDPVAAQRYRIPHIWHGDLESEEGKAMVNCSPNSKPVLMVTKIIIDPHAGEIASGRLYAGTIERGQELFVAGMPGTARAQQVSVAVGPDRITVEKAIAGNIVNVSGLKMAIAGSTVSGIVDFEPFERIVHVSEPVVTVAVEAKHMKDLPKLVEVLRMVAKADPSLQVEINQETGEHLLSGMGELHLEITEYRIEKEHNIPINTSPPIVVYREAIMKDSVRSFEGKSPNKHNRFYFEVKQLPDSVKTAIRNGDLPMGQRIKDTKALSKQLEDLGMDRNEVKHVFWIGGQNIFVNNTKGIQYLYETKELLIDAFKEAMSKGPRSWEPCVGVLVKLVDAKLHEDAIHRGPGQVIPAARSGIYGAMVEAGVTLMEPKQKLFVTVPNDVMGGVNRELNSRRSTIEDMPMEGDQVTIIAKAPVAELFGFASAIRGATQGRALWTTEFQGFDMIPRELLDKVTREIRERKGLKPEPPTADYYSA